MENIFEKLADATRPQTTTYVIYQDNEEKQTFEKQISDSKPFGWLLRNQGQSVNYALKHGGWKVKEINDTTKEETFWKPYA